MLNSFLAIHQCSFLSKLFLSLLNIFLKLVKFSDCPMQDVAVKVLTVQDFHDDQLKEFLREVDFHVLYRSSDCR